MRIVLNDLANVGTGHYSVGKGATCYMFVSLFAHVFCFVLYILWSPV